MDMPPSIAIIGAGPSGLLFARLLEVNGVTDYVVYERDDSSNPGPWQQGGSLDLHGPSGQLALKEAGLFEEFNTVYARWDASKIHILKSSGETIGRFGEGRDAPEIDRLQLRQLLLGSIPAHKVKWGHGVRSIERKETNGRGGKCNDYIIHFTNGTSGTRFKLIVGADGGWSKIRPLVSQYNPKSTKSSTSELRSFLLDLTSTAGVFRKDVYRREDLAQQPKLQNSPRIGRTGNDDGHGAMEKLGFAARGRRNVQDVL